MTKLELILTGWKNWIKRDPKIEALALTRAAVCAECARNKNNMCTKCGCFIPAKIRSQKEKCPLMRW